MADLDILETIAEAVAQGHESDLSSFDPADVRGALDRTLRYDAPREQFFTWFSARVQQLSGGKVTVEELTPGHVQQQEDPAAVPELALRLVTAGEPFAEPVVVRAADPAVQFTMRSG